MSWVEPAIGVASAIAGALGSRTKKLPKEVRNLYRFQYSLADMMRRQAQSTPLSQNYERQSLAQARGELGQQQMAQREQLFSGYNPDTMGQSRNDLELSLTNEQIGQNLSLESQHYLDALQYRRGLYQDAARTAAGATPSAAAYGAGTEQENGLNQMLGALSKGWNTYQASQQSTAKAPGATTSGFPAYQQGPYGQQASPQASPGLTPGLTGQTPGIMPGGPTYSQGPFGRQSFNAGQSPPSSLPGSPGSPLRF